VFPSDYSRTLNADGIGQILSFGTPLNVFFFHYIRNQLKVHRKCFSAIELQLILNLIIVQLLVPWIFHYKFHTIPFPYEGI
jgi:hypothetical protein